MNYKLFFLVTIFLSGTYVSSIDAEIETAPPGLVTSTERIMGVKFLDAYFGTETTIGDTTTQDPMFVRFSNQEDLNTYTPTATNTAGTFRLDTGNEIRAALQGKDYVFVITDLAAYVIQFVGPPFTFSVRQVGTNCGLIGQHSGVDYDGRSYWMDTDNFYVFDGTVKKLPCSVRRFVFDRLNRDQVDKIYAGINSEFTEIIWLYPSTDSDAGPIFPAKSVAFTL